LQRIINVKTMAQRSDHIEKLLEKYVNNHASPDEVQELIGYFETDEPTLDRLITRELRKTVADEAGLDSSTKDLLADRLDRIKSEIHHSTIAEFPAQRRWVSRQAMAVAAAALFCLIVTGYYIYAHGVDKQVVTDDEEILAGSNRALLILADGSELELDGS